MWKYLQKTLIYESAPRELSNEWSCQYVLTIFNFFGNYCVPKSPSVLKELSTCCKENVDKNSGYLNTRHNI
jgi:hypothetical protein